jgi:hypothetical protein
MPEVKCLKTEEPFLADLAGDKHDIVVSPAADVLPSANFYVANEQVSIFPNLRYTTRERLKRAESLNRIWSGNSGARTL